MQYLHSKKLTKQKKKIAGVTFSCGTDRDIFPGYSKLIDITSSSSSSGYQLLLLGKVDEIEKIHFLLSNNIIFSWYLPRSIEQCFQCKGDSFLPWTASCLVHVHYKYPNSSRKLHALYSKQNDPVLRLHIVISCGTRMHMRRPTHGCHSSKRHMCTEVSKLGSFQPVCW